ncbi:MAG TPA: methyltransferase domain-containing protein [Cytophagaceae bacterium]|jgi:2-polyprenyl-3-methyl-5-hydroxy-6-metoxy-1,4-benzoquinol methylase|nr:methyltransferase domain-containing protein [Cytophagaceae bacterium]
MFEKRSEEKEFLDNLLCEGEDLRQNLRELKFINKWLGGNEVTFSGLKEVFKNKSFSNSIHIADLGCGGGDILELIAQWGRTNHYSFNLTGIDANPFIINYARQNTIKFPEINYEVQNIFSEEFSQMKFDIINCTLFCHHFDDNQLVQLFSQLKNQLNVAVVINDLHRHWFAYYSISWLTTLFSRSYMVKNDAKLSVRRGFLKRELEAIIRKSGYTDYSIRWKWAFRWEVVLWK